MNDSLRAGIDYFCPPPQPDEGPLEFQARLIASYFHRDQLRKYTNEPYVVHPARVVQLLRTVEHDDAMLAAAWLHDVKEDCGASDEQLRVELATSDPENHDPAVVDDVISLVTQLTNVSKPSDGNRAVRVALDRAHSAGTSSRAMTIKLCDVIDNVESIVIHDPSFAKKYLSEKRSLLDVLRAGDTFLWNKLDSFLASNGY